MSRVSVTIDQLVLKGLEPAERKALIEGLQAELSGLLSDRATRAEWARPHRTPVMKLGAVPFEPGAAGGRKLGMSVARAIRKGLKP
jgi:hypothetical protein